MSIQDVMVVTVSLSMSLWAYDGLKWWVSF